MHVHSPICQCQLIEEKIRPLTSIVWALGWVEKKGQIKENQIFCFFQSDVTHVSISIFKVISKIKLICRFSHKKVIGYFRFFFLQRPDFFSFHMHLSQILKIYIFIYVSRLLWFTRLLLWI